MRKWLVGLALLIFSVQASAEFYLVRLAGTTQEGSLTAREAVSEDPLTIYEVEVNRETGAQISTPVRLVTRLPHSWAPLYSRDGRRLAYLSAAGLGGAQQVVKQALPQLSIRSIDTEQTSSFTLNFSGPVFAYDWSPDGRTFVFRAADQSGGFGLHLIDAATGDMKPLAIGTPGVLRFTQPHWANDSGHLYYARGVPGVLSGPGGMMERDLETGVERPVFDWSEVKTADGAATGQHRNSLVSPDGRHVAGLGGSGGFGNSTLWLASIETKSARELPLPSGDLSSLNGLPFSWTADGRALLVKRADGPGSKAARSLWLVPIDGSMPVKIAISLPIQNLPAAIHPNGRRIAFVSGGAQKPEVRLNGNGLAPLR